MRRHILPRACATALLLLGNPLLTGHLPFGLSASMAQEEWKAKFEAVCSKTDVAMILSVEELKDLVARCEQLKPKIEVEEESTRKVYLRQLRVCRELYDYVLENKK